MKNYKELIDQFNHLNQDSNTLKILASQAVDSFNIFCKQKLKKNPIAIANYLIKDYLLQKKPKNKVIFKNVLNHTIDLDDHFFQAAIKEISRNESLWFIFKILEIQLFYQSIEQRISETNQAETEEKTTSA